MANWETRYVRIIKEIAAEEGINLKSFDDWAFYLSKDKRQAYIYGYQFGLDKASVAACLKDKAATYEMLKMANIPAVAHWCVMNPLYPEFSSLKSAWDFMKEKLDCHKSLVLKDNLGTGGRSVCKVRNMAEMEQAAQSIFATAQSLAVSPLENISAEYRAVILNGQIVLLFRKDRPALTGDGRSSLAQLMTHFLETAPAKVASGALSEEMNVKVSGLKDKWQTVLEEGETFTLSWKHNLGQGAWPTILDENNPPEKIKDIVERVVELFELKFASVDIVSTDEGMKVMEVNGGVMMENIAGVSPELYEKAKDIYRRAILQML